MADAQRTREPLYLRVYEQIATEIISGGLSQAGKLPPERVISERLGVSRATVRRALAGLEADGLIESVQGRGTFLRTPQLAEPPNALMSFTQLARERGTTAGAVVVAATVRKASIDEADRLRIAPGTDLFELRRLRTMDEVPVAIDRSLVPLNAAPDLPQRDWATDSLYEVLAESGHPPARADYEVEARPATNEQSAWLDLLEGAPVLFAQTISYTRDGRPIELGRIVYRGDRYRFRATLVAHPTSMPLAPAIAP